MLSSQNHITTLPILPQAQALRDCTESQDTLFCGTSRMPGNALDMPLTTHRTQAKRPFVCASQNFPACDLLIFSSVWFQQTDPSYLNLSCIYFYAQSQFPLIASSVSYFLKKLKKSLQKKKSPLLFLKPWPEYLRDPRTVMIEYHFHQQRYINVSWLIKNQAFL